MLCYYILLASLGTSWSSMPKRSYQTQKGSLVSLLLKLHSEVFSPFNIDVSLMFYPLFPMFWTVSILLLCWMLKSILIEPTSGNTRANLHCCGKRLRSSSLPCRARWLILSMPASMSLERRIILLTFGAELVLIDPTSGMKGGVQKVEKLLLKTLAYILQQFDNPSNPKISFEILVSNAFLKFCSLVSLL